MSFIEALQDYLRVFLQPMFVGMLIIFIATLALGKWVRDNKEKETYDGFVKTFGLAAAGLNFIAAPLIMILNKGIPYVDRVSTAFLSMLVGIVIVTMIKLNSRK